MKLFGRLPKGGEGAARLQTLMFSATLHAPEIRDLATKICQNPVFIDLKVWWPGVYSGWHMPHLSSQSPRRHIAWHHCSSDVEAELAKRIGQLAGGSRHEAGV